MRESLVRIGVVTVLATGMFHGTAFAEIAPISEGTVVEVNEYQNPSFQDRNQMLTEAAIAAKIPPEVVKAIAWEESDWLQFKNGAPNRGNDNKGIGIMQVTDYDPNDAAEVERLETDIEYNIKRGIEILNEKYEWLEAGMLPKVEGGDRNTIENWYFPVMAYNGIKPVNSPVKQADGSVNTSAYQEKVFAQIENDSFLGGTKLGEFKFRTEDFEYNPESTENIQFKKLEYTLNNTHESAYFFKKDDSVTVTGVTGANKVNVRTEDLLTVKFGVLENTVLEITGDFKVDDRPASENQFVWYPVETKDGKTGYISSAYLKKAEFTDVEDKYQEAVDYLVSKGVKGKSSTTFGTQQNIKRVDAAVFVAKAKGLDIDAAPDSGFTDVPARAKKEVNALKAAGITQGKKEDTFGAEDLITRGELAIWLQRAFELESRTEELPFNDVADRYEKAVSALVKHGITSGTSSTTFGTEQNAKRGDFALFLYKANQASEK